MEENQSNGVLLIPSHSLDIGTTEDISFDTNDLCQLESLMESWNLPIVLPSLISRYLYLSVLLPQ